MEWNDSRSVPVPYDVDVLGVHLHKYTNAKWEWGAPFWTRRERIGGKRGNDIWAGDSYEPDMWTAIYLPNIPQCAASRKAERHGRDVERARKAKRNIDRALAKGLSGVGEYV